MPLSAYGFLLGSVLFFGPYAAGQNKAKETLNPVTVTDHNPTASFPIGQETLAAAPSTLELSITRVVNQAETPFGIYVSLARSGEQKIPVGNVSLYPADRPNRFLLSTSNAFRTLEKAGFSKRGEIRLVLEMKRLRETKPWTAVEVTIDPPVWRVEGRQ